MLSLTHVWLTDAPTESNWSLDASLHPIQYIVTVLGPILGKLWERVVVKIILKWLILTYICTTARSIRDIKSEGYNYVRGLLLSIPGMTFTCQAAPNILHLILLSHVIELSYQYLLTAE